MTAPDGPAAYSLYELLRTLIERVGWQSEQEKRAALASVDQAEGMQIFGNLASAMACDHSGDHVEGRCVDCGRQIQNTAAPAGRGHSTRYADTPSGRYSASTGRGW